MGEDLGRAVLELDTDASKLNRGLLAAKTQTSAATKAMEKGFAQDATGAMNKAGVSVGSFGKTGVAAVGKITAALGSAIGAAVQFAKRAAEVSLVAGVVLAGGLGMAVHQAAAFEKTMLNVQSIAKMTPADFADMKEQVLLMTRELPQSAEDLASSLYDIQSSGFAGSQALLILRASAQAASAGLASSAEAAAGITAVLNAYGLKATDAAHVSDVLFQVVNRGVITFPELSAEIGKTTAVAAALHVPLTDVAAGISLLTRHGIDGANATTQLNAVMNSLLKPSADATKLARSLGLEWNAAGLKAKGLGGMMADLIEKTDGSAESMAILLGDARATRGAFVLASGGGKEFADELTQFADVAGATDDVLAIQKMGLNYQLSILHNLINEVSIRLGTLLIPHVVAVVQAITGWYDANAGLVNGVGEGLVGALSDVAHFVSRAILPVFRSVIDSAVRWYGANRGLIAQIGQGLWRALQTVGNIIATEVVPFVRDQLIPAFVTIGNIIATEVVPKVAAFVDTLTRKGGVIDSVGAVVGPILEQLVPALGSLAESIFGGGKKQGLLPALGDLIAKLWDNGNGGLALAVKGVGGLLTTMIQTVSDVVDALTGFVHWITGNQTAMDILNATFGLIGGSALAIAASLDATVTAGKALMQWIGDNIGPLKDFLGTLQDVLNQLPGLGYIIPDRPAAPAPKTPSAPSQPPYMRAAGGPVLPGHVYDVGEVARERLVMFSGGGGMVIPSPDSRPNQSQEDNRTTNLNFYGDRPSTSDAIAMMRALRLRQTLGVFG